MRREPFGIGSFLHVVRRGARGLPYLRDKADFQRALLMLAHFNDDVARPYWYRDVLAEGFTTTCERPALWSEKKPLTNIHAFCLQANHFHLLLEETRENGVSAFMQKFGNGLAGYLNEKYGETGSPFQGSYKSKTIDTDEYLRYVTAYIQTKNTFEQYPGGYVVAAKNFAAAYEWSLTHPFSSSFDHLGRSDLPNLRGIVTTALIPTLWTRAQYGKYAADVITGRAHLPTSDQNALRGAFE